MKQKKRNIRLRSIITAILVVIIASIAVFFLMGEFSEGKKEYESQIKKETQELTGKLVSELEDVDTSDEGLAGQQITTEKPDQAPEELKTEAEKQAIEDQLEKIEDERKQRVLQTLSVAYSKALEDQKQEAFRMVENLVAQGKSDWAALVSKGENTATNKAKLASEYLAKSQVLEKQMDASFDILIATMETQLEREGIDPASMIDQYQTEYKRIKEENRQALMDKILAALKN